MQITHVDLRPVSTFGSKIAVCLNLHFTDETVGDGFIWIPEFELSLYKFNHVDSIQTRTDITYAVFEKLFDVKIKKS
ncbi:hypothetical protein [Enterobacillus tribolii]|uniref:Uncharacterized protein n=1 Tax=Enterobacillus tribolii TaxID=1487935 RepID=A0A370QEJ8_9GAMM|nr:hypothetical protein [Enterobacillus tribolii]MBW7984147.1 hypothetical protein [Enterobacillus tribolii]RDK86792.1 hypothetical protein C8D90_11066 [Enterobacillus tribolii]